MKLITKDDIIESFYKIKQRGLKFFLSKFNLKSINRTKSTFNIIEKNSSNFWDIPLVQSRWNKKITGNENINWIDYFCSKYISPNKEMTILSLGSGNCEIEIYLSQQYPNIKIICVDISEKLLQEVRRKHPNIENIEFFHSDINKIQFDEIGIYAESIDLCLFKQSLHHFKNIDSLLGNKIFNVLKKDGHIIINEYVGPNRFQFPKDQIDKINEVLAMIPDNYKFRLNSKSIKKNISGPGIFRMILSDPSEAIESEQIMPVLNQYYNIIEEKKYGNDILMLLFKDIAHNFINKNKIVENLLDKIFAIEDSYLLNSKSNFVLSIFKK